MSQHYVILLIFIQVTSPRHNTRQLSFTFSIKVHFPEQNICLFVFALFLILKNVQRGATVDTVFCPSLIFYFGSKVWVLLSNLVLIVQCPGLWFISNIMLYYIMHFIVLLFVIYVCVLWFDICIIYYGISIFIICVRISIV